MASLEKSPDRKVEQAWQKEIQRRIRVEDSGRVKFIPWEFVQAKLKRRLHEAH